LRPWPIPLFALMRMESDNALRALEFGAVEIIQKTKLGTKQFLEESRVRIVESVKAANHSREKLGRAKVRPARTVLPQVAPKLTADVMLPKPDRVMAETTEKVVVVGASTGGTEALKEFLVRFPEDAPGNRYALLKRSARAISSRSRTVRW
jgi:two-component system chemotaxis response regulator CheB